MIFLAILAICLAWFLFGLVGSVIMRLIYGRKKEVRQYIAESLAGPVFLFFAVIRLFFAVIEWISIRYSHILSKEI